MTDFSSWLSSEPNAYAAKIAAHSIRDGASFPTHVLIRILTGGELSQMGDILIPKMKMIKRNWERKGFTVEYESLNQDQVKNVLKWSMEEAVDWLLKADVHFLLCHPHQGNVGKTEKWTVQEIYKNINRLSGHLGYPMGNKLKCPVFTQDKYAYIENLSGFMNPTLRVDLIDPSQSFSSDTIEGIKSFMDAQNVLGYSSFIVKKSFVTNAGCKRNLKTLDDVLRVIRIEAKRKIGFQFYPYILVQPQMSNYSEAKVVCFNGRAMYIWMIKAGARGQPFSKEFSNKEALFAFAESAIQVLKMNSSAFTSNGLVRVDVFVDDFGKFVVNEIESLEARYLTDLAFPSKEEIYVRKNLPEYWVQLANELIHEAVLFNESMGKYNNVLSTFSSIEEETKPTKKKKKTKAADIVEV